MGMFVIAVLISALAEQKWFKLHGGQCTHQYVGVYQFLTPGLDKSPDYELCLNDKVVVIMRSVISFIFMSIVASLFAFFLDVLGPMKTLLKLIRRHAIGNVVTVLLCVTINGFCYWSAMLMEEVLQEHIKAPGSRVVVSFEVGFYLIVASGALSVIISATNLLRPYSSYEESIPRERLVEDWDELLEAGVGGPPAGAGATVLPSNMPPPPAYTP